MRHEISILIADADVETRTILIDNLKLSYTDCTINFVETGKDLLRILNNKVFDLIFLDMILPHTEINKLSDALKNKRNCKECRLILITESLRTQWVHLAIYLNAYEVLLKPYKSKVISQMIDSYKFSRSSKDVLIVDKSKAIRAFLRAAVETSDFNILAIDAETGQRAIQKSRSNLFDLAFISTKLPDVSAYEVGCQLMKISEEKTSIVLTDSDPTASWHASRVLGVKEIMRVPFHVGDVNRAIYGALGLWRPYLINAITKSNEQKINNSFTKQNLDICKS